MTFKPPELPKAEVRAPDAEPSLDFHRLFATLRRHVRIFAATAVIVAGAVAATTLPAAPRYQATATLLIDEHTPDVLHLNELSPQDAGSAYGASSSAVDTQVQVLRSPTLASAVVDQLHLDQDPEFNPALRPPGGKLAAIRHLFARPDDTANLDPAQAKAREHERVVNAVMGDLNVKRAGLTYTIDIIFTSFNAYKAAEISNAFAQRYLTQGLDTKIDQTHSATSWLDSRLGQLRGDVQNADAAVQQFKIANNLLSAEGATLTEQEISTLDTQLAQARAQTAEQDARLNTAEHQLAAGSNGGDVGEALSNPVVQSLRAQRAQESALLANLQSRYGDRYPDVIKTKRSLADIDTQIGSEIARTISNLKAQSQVAHTRTQSLADTVASSRNTLVGNNRSLVRLDELQRDDDAARAIYEAFLSRYKEALAKEGGQPADASMVASATPPTDPSSPNRKLDIMIAIAAGLVAGAMAMLLAEFFSRGVSNSEEIEDLFALPALGEVPTLASTLDRSLKRNRVTPINYVVSKPLSRFAEAFRNLRTSVLASRTGQPVQVVAITSALPNEGKTITALCLARTMALAGSRVVVVDCDLRQRSVNRALSADPKAGLIEVLNGTISLDEALLFDDMTGARILPLAASAFSPRDVFGSEAMRGLIGDLRKRFDIVIMDTAPVLAVADTRVLAPLADAVLFITRWRKTPRKAVLAALRAINSDDIYIAGMALTQVNIREQALAGEGAAPYYRAYQKYYAG